MAPDRPQPKGLGQYRSGRSDVSERAEEILRERAAQRALGASPTVRPEVAKDLEDSMRETERLRESLQD
ncbi:MAG: hypothetical protein R2991_04170 [Thermoanaerobaculia bacterium]